MGNRVADMTPEEREKRRAYMRKYYAANREKLLASQRAYCAANREKRLASQRAYCAANRERICGRFLYLCASVKRRRGDILTPADLMKLWKLQRGRCQYTGRVMTPRPCQPNTISLERVDSTKGYTLDNVIFVCVAVNRMKSDFPLPEFVTLCRDVAKHNPTL